MKLMNEKNEVVKCNVHNVGRLTMLTVPSTDENGVGFQKLLAIKGGKKSWVCNGFRLT